jgi:hypothetical protein
VDQWSRIQTVVREYLQEAFAQTGRGFLPDLQEACPYPRPDQEAIEGNDVHIIHVSLLQQKAGTYLDVEEETQ